MTWQPIETATKDRREEAVILYRPTWKGRVNSDGIDIAYWDDDRHAFKPRPFWHSLFKHATKANMRNHSPTHWQPRPVPPSAAEGGW
jgi:hypothetical protein